LRYRLDALRPFFGQSLALLLLNGILNHNNNWRGHWGRRRRRRRRRRSRTCYKLIKQQ
jgi:hypothetical protein